MPFLLPISISWSSFWLYSSIDGGEQEPICPTGQWWPRHSSKNMAVGQTHTLKKSAAGWAVPLFWASHKGRYPPPHHPTTPLAMPSCFLNISLNNLHTTHSHTTLHTTHYTNHTYIYTTPHLLHIHIYNTTHITLHIYKVTYLYCTIIAIETHPQEVIPYSIA